MSKAAFLGTHLNAKIFTLELRGLDEQLSHKASVNTFENSVALQKDVFLFC